MDRRGIAAVALALAAATASRASADPAVAQAAFDDAQKLVAAGHYAAACPKFALSYQQDPQLGALLHLADCHEHVGKLATAWAEYSSAIELARRAHDKREAAARERADKLAPRVAHVVVHAPAGATVQLDGRDITAMVDSAIPVDAGTHEVALAGGEATTVTIDGDGDREEVRLAAPDRAHGAAAHVVAHDAGDRDVGHRHLGMAAVAVGAVAIGVGLGFGDRAYANWSDSRPLCGAGDVCQPRGGQLIDAANRDATAADVLVGVGVAAAVTGAILWATAPRARERAVAIAPSVSAHAAGLALGGQF
jgi:tetratricopeptide (TPR) repeat protein|nr:hypothetical protein [Kofleriaceae bacterium]